MVTDENGTLSRIDPAANKVRQTISIPAGSYNPLFADGIIWVTGFDTNVVTSVDDSSGRVLASIAVGPKPRFLAAGAGSIWTLNQGDGTISRVDQKSRKVTATIRVGIPGRPFLPGTLLMRHPLHLVSLFVVAHGIAVRPNLALLDGIGCSSARHSPHAQNVLTESLKLLRLDLVFAMHSVQLGDRKCSV
jgi:DNA-binding beta-propeller fold protein YncE